MLMKWLERRPWRFWSTTSGTCPTSPSPWHCSPRRLTQTSRPGWLRGSLPWRTKRRRHRNLWSPSFPRLVAPLSCTTWTEDSWEFFSIIKVDDNWLEQPVNSWKLSEDYRTARMFVHTAKTTNYLAERAIKSATDYSQILSSDQGQGHQEEDHPGGGGPQEELPGLQ